MESIVTVSKTGAVTTLSVMAPAGLLLYNDHDTASVTISSSAQIIPGAGITIKPKGTVRWSAPREPVYAVTGSGIDVPILVTDEVGEVASPLDVAVATATRLTSEGIPSVMLSDIVYDARPVTNPLPAWGLYFPVKLSGYASVLMYLVADSNTAHRYELYWRNERADGGYTTGARITFPRSNVSGVVISIPVQGEYLFINTSAHVTIVGTNRELEQKNVYESGISRYARNGAWNAGDTLMLTGHTANADGDYFYHSGGPFTLSTYCAKPGGIQIEGIFKVAVGGYTTDLCHTNQMAASPQGNGVVNQFTRYLPIGAYRFFFLVTTTHSGGTVQLDIYPQ